MKIVIGILAALALLSLGEPSWAQGPALGCPEWAASGPRRCSTREERRNAKEAFSRGIAAFENRDWLQTQYAMLEALSYDCGDDFVFVPYGRWVYKYQPKTYLGLALHRLGHCLTQCGNCPETSNWQGSWQAFLRQHGPATSAAKACVDLDVQRRCRMALSGRDPAPWPAGDCQTGGCFDLRLSTVTYCPVIDWWRKLERAGASNDAVDCGDVTTPLEWFARAFRMSARAASAEEICKDLEIGLSRVRSACAAIQ